MARRGWTWMGCLIAFAAVAAHGSDLYREPLTSIRLACIQIERTPVRDVVGLLKKICEEKVKDHEDWGRTYRIN